MSQKYIKSQNNNSHNAKTYGKYYAKPSYDEKFIETEEIADFMRKLEMSLKEFDTDYIDYYHMHALNAKSWSHAKQVEMGKNMLMLFFLFMP